MSYFAASHLCQPLDVSFFRPVKAKWRSILAEYKTAKGKKRQTIQRDQFPNLLKELLDSLEPIRESNLPAGFRITGIFLLDREPVLSRLPREIEDETKNESINKFVSEMFDNHLQQLRCGGTRDPAPPRKKRRPDVEPGKNVQRHVGKPNLDVPVSQNVLLRLSDAD